MRKSLVPIAAVAACFIPGTVAAQSLTFMCQQTAEIVVNVKDNGTTASHQPKMSQPQPIRIVVEPNFTRTGQTSGPAAILEDRGPRKERFEGTIVLGKSIDAHKGAWHLDLKAKMLRVVEPRGGRTANFAIYRCGTGTTPPKPPRTAVFRCEDSQKVVATFRDGTPDTVEVEFGNGEKRVLPIARSGSGARYADKEYVFWNKGKEAIWKTPKRETTCVTNQ